MRTLVLNDPKRRGTWLEQLQPGDYPVFVRDGTTWAERNTEGRPLRPGEPGVCLVFPGLDEAKSFCRQAVREQPHLRCDVYDHDGLAKPPLYSVGEKEWNPTPRALMVWAAVSLLASIPLFWLDWHMGGELVLASIIGINLVAAGIRFLFWGLGTMDAHRDRLQRTS
jgi:hypothetical protein